MMVMIGDQPYNFRFKTEFYDSPIEVRRTPSSKWRCIQAITECNISKGEAFTIETMVAGERAYCSVSDVFDVHEGRRLALRRALESFTDDERKIFWDRFRRTLPQQKPSYAALQKLVRTLTQERDAR